MRSSTNDPAYVRGTVRSGQEVLIPVVSIKTTDLSVSIVANVYTATTVSIPEFTVNDGDTVIFAVRVTGEYNIDDGSISLDLASGQDYRVSCPALVVELLSLPIFQLQPRQHDELPPPRIDLLRNRQPA
jgi:hypothetical protein